MTKTKYTTEGSKVEVLASDEDQYLHIIRRKWSIEADDDEDQEGESMEELYTGSLFDAPPTEVKNKILEERTARLQELNKQIAEANRKIENLKRQLERCPETIRTLAEIYENPTGVKVLTIGNFQVYDGWAAKDRIRFDRTKLFIDSGGTNREVKIIQLNDKERAPIIVKRETRKAIKEYTDSLEIEKILYVGSLRAMKETIETTIRQERLGTGVDATSEETEDFTQTMSAWYRKVDQRIQALELEDSRKKAKQLQDELEKIQKLNDELASRNAIASEPTQKAGPQA